MSTDPGRQPLPPGLLWAIAVHVFVHAEMAGIRLAAPLLALGQGYGKLHAGLLVALIALGQMLLALRAGRLADLHGLKRPGLLGISLGVAAGLIAAAWPVFEVLCVSAMLCGASLVITMVSVQRHLGRAVHESTQLRRAFAWFSLAPPLANFSGPLVAGWFIDHAGYRVAFAVLGLLPLLSWLCLRRTSEPYERGRHTAAPGTAWDLWRDPAFRNLMLVNWLFSAGWDIYNFMVPVLGHERGMSASAIGVLMGVYAASAFAVRGFVPALANRFPEWPPAAPWPPPPRR